MKTYPHLIPGAALLALLLLARQGHSQTHSPLAAAALPSSSSGLLATEPATTAAPLQPQPASADGWLLLAGSLPTPGTYTADVMAPDGRSMAHRTWHGLTAGPVQLALNLRTVPPGSYTLVLGQDNQRWQLPLVQR